MKNQLLLFFVIPMMTSCYKFTKNEEHSTITTLKGLQEYTISNCRFEDFKIGNYNNEESQEKFGLDTLKRKYIWYSNDNGKIIINTFHKENFAVKYAYTQIHKTFPKLSGAFIFSVNSKETEKSILLNFKAQSINWHPLVTFEDALGYRSEIEIDKCDSNKAEAVLRNYPEITINYND